MPTPRDHDHNHDHDGTEGVRISPREIYREIRGLAELCAEIKSKLEASIQINALQFNTLKSELTDLEQRVKDVEKRPALNPKTLTTVISLVIAATGVIVGFVSVVTK